MDYALEKWSEVKHFFCVVDLLLLRKIFRVLCICTPAVCQQSIAIKKNEEAAFFFLHCQSEQSLVDVLVLEIKSLQFILC